MNDRETLLEELASYVTSDAREETMRQRMRAFVASEPQAFGRACATGHVTASAWVVDRERRCALLTHHRKLDKWLQLGGHTDGDADVRAAALREAREESGLRSLRFVTNHMYDLDIHQIPARGSEGEHEHFDVRFALEADRNELLVVSAESHTLAWVALDELPSYGADESVLRLARKTLTLPASETQSDTALPAAGTPRS